MEIKNVWTVARNSHNGHQLPSVFSFALTVVRNTEIWAHLSHLFDQQVWTIGLRLNFIPWKSAEIKGLRNLLKIIIFQTSIIVHKNYSFISKPLRKRSIRNSIIVFKHVVRSRLRKLKYNKNNVFNNSNNNKMRTCLYKRKSLAHIKSSQ